MSKACTNNHFAYMSVSIAYTYYNVNRLTKFHMIYVGRYKIEYYLEQVIKGQTAPVVYSVRVVMRQSIAYDIRALKSGGR